MTTATMQLVEPMNFSRSCLDKSIASISKGLIGSPCCGRAPSSPRLALKPLYENKVTTVQSAKPSPKSPTKEQKKQDSAAVCVTKDLIGVKDKPWNKACEAKPKKSSEVDNGELIEILNENRQQTKPKAHKSCRRNMSIDVASLSHSNNESSAKSTTHFLLFYQENTVRLPSRRWSSYNHSNDSRLCDTVQTYSNKSIEPAQMMLLNNVYNCLQTWGSPNWRKRRHSGLTS